jgi:TPR repeat protein
VPPAAPVPPATPLAEASPTFVPPLQPSDFDSRCLEGDARACATSGIGYQLGTQGPAIFYPVDPGKAALFHQKACSLGVLDSCESLGILLGKGVGVPQDYQRALDLFDGSCRSGLASSCFLASSALMAGHGITKERGGAIAYLRRACDGHLRQACEVLSRLPTGDPPEGAAGFGLGMPLEETRARCEAAGKVFARNVDQQSHYFCSGPAADVGFRASVEFDLCADGRVCAITVNDELGSKNPSEWLREHQAIRARLTATYGAPTSDKAQLPPACFPKLGDCLADGRALVLSVWSWPASLSVGLYVKAAANGGAIIRIGYSLPSSSRVSGARRDAL